MIHRLAVAKTYLIAEIPKSKKLVEPESPFRQTLEKPIEQLLDSEIMDLLRLFSSDIRRNSVFEYITDENLQWHFQTVPVDQIYLTLVNHRVNPVLKQCGYNLKILSDYLDKYFDKNQSADPLNLNEFRPVPRNSENLDQLLGIYHGDEVFIIDGVHRALSRAMRGVTSIDLYLGSQNSIPVQALGRQDNAVSSLNIR